jgi:hypothetical protein
VVAAFLASAPTVPGAPVATGGRVADAVLAAAMRAAIADGMCDVEPRSDGFAITDSGGFDLYHSAQVFPDADALARSRGTPTGGPHGTAYAC